MRFRDNLGTAKLLRREEGWWWSIHIQCFKGKEHFLRYAGRYARRPPIAECRIQDVSNGLVSFWYRDKRLKQQQTVVCTVTEFIDRWAQHIPKRYRHAVRYCGIFASRHWNQVAETAFLLSGQRRRSKPKRLPWNLSVHRLWGHDPLTDNRKYAPTTHRCAHRGTNDFESLFLIFLLIKSRR